MREIEKDGLNFAATVGDREEGTKGDRRQEEMMVRLRLEGRKRSSRRRGRRRERRRKRLENNVEAIDTHTHTKRKKKKNKNKNTKFLTDDKMSIRRS